MDAGEGPKPRLSPISLRLLAVGLLGVAFLYLLAVGVGVATAASGGACQDLEFPQEFPDDLPLEGVAAVPDSRFDLFPVGSTCTWHREGGMDYVLDFRSWSGTAILAGAPVIVGAATWCLIAARRRDRLNQ